MQALEPLGDLAKAPARATGAPRRGWLEWLMTPAGMALLAAAALGLTAFALDDPFMADDHQFFEAFLKRGLGPLALFRLDHDTIAGLRRTGVLPWWSSPELSVKFLRPLASLSHWLDWFLFGQNAVPMRAVQCLLYAALVSAAAFSYRALLPPASAALASLMFLLEDGHASVVGWISSRNTVLGTLFAMLALLCHVRGQPGSATRRWLAPLCTALALLSGEAGLCTLAYLVAYAVTLDQGAWRTRLLRIAPHLMVAATWALVYVGGGFGVRGAGLYRDPVAHPLGTLLAAIADLPVWLFGAVGLNVINLGLLLPRPWPQWIALGLVSPLLALLLPVLRHDPKARFFALGALLSIAPLGLTLPQDRLLIGASFGFMGWIAFFASHAVTAQGFFRRAGAYAILALHLGLAPLLFVPALSNLQPIERAVQSLVRAVPEAGGKHVVILGSPLEVLTLYPIAVRRLADMPAPASLHALYAGFGDLKVTRVDARTFDLHVERGYGFTPLELTFTREDGFPAPGQMVRVDDMTATVQRCNEAGAPTDVRFTFASELESPEREWLIWTDGPTRWTPPPIGGVQHIAAPQLARVLSR